MELKTLLKNRKKYKESKNIRDIKEWQDYAANICKEFNIEGVYKKQIFAMCKPGSRCKRSFLEGKVAMLREIKSFNSFKYKQLHERNKLGNYLFAMFRKK